MVAWEKKGIIVMNKKYDYVPRSEYLPVKKELEILINFVQDEVRDCFTFSFTYVGSTHRHLITKNTNSNVGYDFDVNIHVNDDQEEFEADEIRHTIMNAFNKHVRQFGYDYCENHKRVFTIKRKNIWNSTIISSCDFAIVYDCHDGRQQYIHFDKKFHSYYWEYLPVSNTELERRADTIKKNQMWSEVRNRYLEKKNDVINEDKKSRSLYAETINEIYKSI